MKRFWYIFLIGVIGGIVIGYLMVLGFLIFFNIIYLFFFNFIFVSYWFLFLVVI